MKKFAVALYQYFLIRKLPTPYFRTIMVMVGFIMLHTFLLFSIFPIPETLSPFGNSKIQVKNWIPTAIFIGILYLILCLLFKKSYLEKYSFSDIQRKRHLKRLAIYSIIIAALIVLCSLYHIKNIW
jgi:hypothetical protein